MHNYICFIFFTSFSESPDLRVAKAKDLQSTSTLEQFMAKLCPHHQRQIVDAIGFLQTEVKALASSNTHQAAKFTSRIQETSCSTSNSLAITPEKLIPEIRIPSESTPKTELQNISHSSPSSCTLKTVAENAMSLKTPVTSGCGLDLRSPRSVPPILNPTDPENNHHGDHAPLKMKIMASNVADGKKLSCVLNASLSTHSDPLDNRHRNLNSSNRTETHSARLSSTVKKHHQASHTYQARQKETLEHAKETAAICVTIPSNSPRTARKTIRSRDAVFRGMTDPDLGHCDIVFIDKPITECFKEQHRSMLPRRNARKSTRGHMYSDEIWELKTVRTLTGRGNCPNPMPELTTLVTPKQILSKPEGLPPVDRPFVGPCRETMHQPMPTEGLDESVIPGTGDTVEVAASEVDVIVETSQTDQCQNKGQSSPAPMRSPKEKENAMDMTTDVEHDTHADLDRTIESEVNVAQASCEAGVCNKPELQEDRSEHSGQIEMETNLNPLDDVVVEESEPPLLSETVHKEQPPLQQNSVPSSPSAVNQVVEEKGDNRSEESQDRQELQPEPQTHSDNLDVKENSFDTSLTNEPLETEPKMKTSELVCSFVPLETDENSDYDVSSKTLDALLKELPPWRRKKGTIIPLPKRLKQTEPVIVGYVNGRPISASDRSLRRRSGNNMNESLPNANHDVPSTASGNSTIDSTFENKKLEKPLPETDRSMKSFETNTMIVQVTEKSSDAPSSHVPEVPRSKQVQKQKRVQRDQDTLSILSDQPLDHRQGTESTRQLRSASQKSAVNPPSSPSLNDLTSISPPKPTATSARLPTEEPHPTLLPSHIPNMSPPVINSTPTADSELSQQNLGTTVKLSTENADPVETAPEESQKTEAESRMQAKQKLRSAKVGDNSKNEKQEPLGGVSNALENESPIKTEMQAQTPLRSKRILRKDTEAIELALQQKPNVASLGDRATIEHDNSCSVSDRHSRMPLRNESSKSETFHQPVTQPTPVYSKKLALRSQSSAAIVSSGVIGRQCEPASPIRVMSERITKAQGKSSSVSGASVSTQSLPIVPKPEPPKQTVNKFFETLTGEESQHLISNLNIKYDKMQKGWVQMDKEGQPGPKYKSKADRQAAIWKSKRRARKPKSSDHQKYSPVQMLFMKSFNLSRICRWFLESTETKSLVIVKKVNTRLPSETQLCFHSSSSTSGSSQGVFPSLQAERLKKHLKKFAIASPVKSNPKSQKLIAKALEQDVNAVKGKERREVSSTTRTLSKSRSSAQACLLIGESQKSSGKSKNPASARILRKYSNIREKMQVQQTNARLKRVSKTLKNGNMKRLATTKSSARSSLKTQKSALGVSKQIKASATKMERRKALGSKKKTKHPAQDRGAKAQSSNRGSRDATKKEVPKRCSQRLGSPKTFELIPADTSKTKADSKTPAESQKAELEKPAVNKMNATKVQPKESSQSALTEIKCTENSAETSQHSTDVKVPASPDQVLTRSQRKIEAAVPSSGSPSQTTKRASRSVTTQNASPKSARKAEEHTLTRSGALKSPVKRRQAASLPRNASRRAQELLETPAKRKRTSLSK